MLAFIFGILLIGIFFIWWNIGKNVRTMFVAVGFTGSGKSLWLADTTLKILETNKKRFEKKGIRRVIASNLKLSENIEKEYDGFINYWTDLRQLPDLKHCDVIIDEISIPLDAQLWAELPVSVRSWFRQHRKHGVRIYGTAQSLTDITVSMRRLLTPGSVRWHSKIMGSADPSETLEPVDKVWGWTWSRAIASSSYHDEPQEYKLSFWSFEFLEITKARCEIYDTTQVIKTGEYPPLRHIEKFCEDKNCILNKNPKISHA